MLKIKSVEYKLCTRGPAIAHPILVIDFESVESYDGVLFDDFKAAISAAGLEDVYQSAINYKQNVFFLFKGRLFTKENIPLYTDLFTSISRESAQLQKTLMDAHTINVGQLRPPFFMWEGIPQDFTGVENAYTDFNIPYVILDETTEYSQIALQQILNHPMGTVFIRWVDGKKTPKFYAEFEEAFHAAKVFLLADVKHFDEAKEWALKNQCCVYPDL